VCALEASPPSLSIIVATYNEERLIGPLLEQLSSHQAGELIVADGGSLDRTVEIAEAFASVVKAPTGRALQFNCAARQAHGDVLLFLHADVRLGRPALMRLCEAMQDPSITGGNFNVSFDGNDLTAALFTRINGWRRRFGVFYGDSGIFVRRSFFEATGGFRPWPILEDYEFGRRLWRAGAVALLDEPIHVSDRRWKNGGLVRTMWAWFWVQGLFLAGVSPNRLARLYQVVR